MGQAKLIPKDASLIMVINTTAIEEKTKNISFDKLDSTVNSILPKEDSYKFVKEFGKLKEAIDFKDKFVFFMTQNLKGKETITNLNLIASLKNAKLMEAALKSNEDWKNKSITVANGYSYFIPDNMFAISWNDKFVMLSINPSKEVFNYDNINHSFKTIPADTTTFLKQIAKYYALPDSESVASIKEFNDLTKEKADIYSFSNSTYLTSYLSLMPIQLVKLDSLVRDNYSASTISFENGKVETNGTIYLNKGLAALFKKYSGTMVKTSLLDAYPTQNINGFILASFNPEILEGLLKELNVESLLDGFLFRQGLSTKDIYQCLNGDINIAFSDFKMGKNDKGSSSSGSAKYLMEASIGNKESFKKLMDLLLPLGYIIKDGNGYTLSPTLSGYAYLHTDDSKIIVATDAATYKDYISGKSKNNIDESIKSAVKGKSVAMYLNIDNMLSGIGHITIYDTLISNNVQRLRNTIKDAIVTGDNLKDNMIKSHGELRLKDDKQNSLVLLHNMCMEIFKSVSSSFRKPNNSVIADSTVHSE